MHSSTSLTLSPCTQKGTTLACSGDATFISTCESGYKYSSKRQSGPFFLFGTLYPVRSDVLLSYFTKGTARFAALSRALRFSSLFRVLKPFGVSHELVDNATPRRSQPYTQVNAFSTFKPPCYRQQRYRPRRLHPTNGVLLELIFEVLNAPILRSRSFEHVRYSQAKCSPFSKRLSRKVVPLVALGKDTDAEVFRKEIGFYPLLEA